MSLRCLLYARQSIEHEGGDRSLSIDSQIDVLRAHCAREGWHVVAEVREAGLKGWQDADERPGLADAMSRAEAREIDILLVWDLSRLARSVRIQEHLVWQFARCGVQIVSHSEPHAGDALIRQVLGAVAEHRTREISAHVRRALQERHQRGLSHGHVPLGYQRVDGVLHIDEDAAATIRRIYEQRANGASWGQIALALERDGIRPPRGGAWSKNSLIKMVGNPLYRGERIFGASRSPQPCPAIVTPEVWERAQRRDDLRPRAPRAGKPLASWLEGLVFHGCGRPMYLSPHRGQGRLRCASNIGLAVHSCAVRPYTAMAPRVERDAWAIIAADLEAARRLPLRSIVADARRRYQRARPGNAAAIDAATAQRERATQRRARAEELYLSGARDRAWFEAEDAKIAADLATIDATLRQLPAPPDTAAIEAVWQELRVLSLQIGHITSPAARAIVLRRLGRVVVDGVEVRLDYQPHIRVILGLCAPYGPFSGEMEP